MAATFFGEVVKAPCRAGTEEEEEEEEQSRRDTPEDREVRAAGAEEGGSASPKTDRNISGGCAPRDTPLLQVYNCSRKQRNSIPVSVCYELGSLGRSRLC